MSVACRIVTAIKRELGPCNECDGDIIKGQLYSTVVVRLGKSKAGKQKWRSVKVHLDGCLAKWVIVDYTRFSTRRKARGGRPEGTGLQLDDNSKKERRHLTRTRARLMRLLLETDDVDRIKMLVGRITVTSERITALGGALNPNLMRRSLEAREAVNAQLKIGGSHA